MKCANCGFENEEQAIFCEGCGKRIKQITYCKFCGNPLTGLETYCANCKRDKDGNEKGGLEQLKKAIENIPEIKPEYKETIKASGQKLGLSRGKVLVLITEVVLAVSLFVKWIKLNAVEDLQYLIGYFFDYDYGMETEFSAVKVFMQIMKLNDVLDSDEVMLICTAFLVMALGIIIAFGVSAYHILNKEEGWDLPFQIGCALYVAFSGLFLAGSFYISSELTEYLDDVFSSALTLTLVPYICLAFSIWLLVKGIAMFREMEREK